MKNDKTTPDLQGLFERGMPHLPEDELKAFLSHWTISRDLARGESLFPPGRAGRTIFFVERGALRIIYEAAGQEMTVGFSYPGTLVADYPGILHRQPSGFLIQALRKSELRGIPAEQFFRFVDESPRFARFWRHTLEQALLGRIEREIDLLTPSPHERLERLLRRSPHVFQHIPLRHIAAYLRMTPETLSRLRKP